jgi:hypothetical protein
MSIDSSTWRFAGAVPQLPRLVDAPRVIPLEPLPRSPWAAVFDLQRECTAEGTNMIEVLHELGDEWAAATEGWSA